MSEKQLGNGEIERNERQVSDYILHVRGVFGRNRKEKRDNFRLSRTPVGENVGLEALLAAAAYTCGDIKLKIGAIVTIDCNPVTLKDYDNGDGRTVTLESFLLYSGACIFRGTWDGKKLV